MSHEAHAERVGKAARYRFSESPILTCALTNIVLLSEFDFAPQEGRVDVHTFNLYRGGHC